MTNGEGQAAAVAVASMTGFAAAAAVGSHCEIEVEIRSVNSRFLDLAIRLPRGYSPLEGELRERLAKSVRRGRVEVTVQRRSLLEGSGLSFRKEVFDRYVALVLAEGERLAAEPRLTMSDVLHILTSRGVLEGDEPEVGVEHERPVLVRALDSAIVQLCEMRMREGAGLAADIRGRLASVTELLGRVAQSLPRVLLALHERWKTRVAGLFAELPIPEERIATELALRAERCDIAEELTRAHGHLAAIDGALAMSPCGRRIDFLVQELTREISTSLAKVQDSEVTPLLLECRLLAEQVREQAQNLE